MLPAQPLGGINSASLVVPMLTLLFLALQNLPSSNPRFRNLPLVVSAVAT